MVWLFLLAGMVAIVLPAHASDWFVEGGLGGSHGRIAHVKYDDPVGSIFT